MKKRFNLTKDEARLVRTGLKILRDSLYVGPDYDYYRTEGDQKYRRELQRCKRELLVVKDLLTALKGM